MLENSGWKYTLRGFVKIKVPQGIKVLNLASVEFTLRMSRATEILQLLDSIVQTVHRIFRTGKSKAITMGL